MKLIEKIDKYLEHAARIKYRITRLVFYVSVAQTALLISIRGWTPWYLLFIPYIAVAYLFERKYGLKKEQETVMLSNEILLNKLDEILKCIKSNEKL